MVMKYGMITKGKYKGKLCYFTDTIVKTHNYMCYPVNGYPYRIVISKTAIKEIKNAI